MDHQRYGSSTIWIINAMDNQCYGSSTLWIINAMDNNRNFKLPELGIKLDANHRAI
jgi:hypothetical protein